MKTEKDSAMKNKIKNYTSSVPVERTMANIERILANAGAFEIIKKYLNGRVSMLFFNIKTPEGRTISIQLPSNEESVFQQLRKCVKRPREGTLEKLRDQANRTTWKLMQDWIEVQISLIELQQIELVQVFLPYVWDGNTTFYEALKVGEFLQLPEKSYEN